MKFRKGNSVEVLRREHDPCSSWFPGTIVSLDGNNYIVRYKFLLDDEGDPVLEKVCRVDIRPLPLRGTGKRWRVGDIAEVFDNQCWRLGKIAKVLQKNWFVIRLFGSIRLKEFHESNIRIRRSWHNNKWWLTGKVAQNKQFPTEKDSKYSLDFSSTAPSLKMGQDLHLREYHGQRCHEDGCDDFKIHSRLGIVKRFHADNYETNFGDMLVAGNHKKRKSSPCIGGCTQMDNKMVKAAANQFHISYAPLSSSEDSNQCSVASCSSNGFAGENVHKSVENISNDSDAESSFPSSSGKKHEFPYPRHKLEEVDIHELELHAYESTVQALYASGPLSWEQESLLTNLRLCLNISDEEHLLQLRHLLSAQVL